MAFLNPSANNTDQIGEAGTQWGAVYAQSFIQNGSAVATLAGPAFTGVPTAPTAALDASTTQLATTAFVQAQFAKSGGIAGASIADGGITNGKLADAAAWTIKVRNAATSGDLSDAALGDLTEEATPAAGMFALGFLSGGEIRTFDLGNVLNGLTADSVATLTNKSIDADNNTLTNIDTGALKDGAVTNAKIADAAGWTFKIRNAATSGDLSDAALADFTAAGTPGSGDFVIGFLSSGEIRKYDFDDLPLPTIPADTVSNAQLANMAAWKGFKGNITTGSANPTD